ASDVSPRAARGTNAPLTAVATSPSAYPSSAKSSAKLAASVAVGSPLTTIGVRSGVEGYIWSGPGMLASQGYLRRAPAQFKEFSRSGQRARRHRQFGTGTERRSLIFTACATRALYHCSVA